MTAKPGGQKRRRSMIGRKASPRVGKRPVKLVVADRKQQSASEHRRMGGR